MKISHDIYHYYGRALTARNSGPHQKAIRTIEKFAGADAADALGKKVGAHNLIEEMTTTIRLTNTPWIDLLRRKAKQA